MTASYCGYSMSLGSTNQRIASLISRLMRVPHSTDSRCNCEIITVAPSHYIVLTAGYSLRSRVDALAIAPALGTTFETAVTRSVIGLAESCRDVSRYNSYWIMSYASRTRWILLGEWN